jgi:hypothetical protein
LSRERRLRGKDQSVETNNLPSHLASCEFKIRIVLDRKERSNTADKLDFGGSVNAEE